MALLDHTKILYMYSHILSKLLAKSDGKMRRTSARTRLASYRERDGLGNGVTNHQRDKTVKRSMSFGRTAMRSQRQKGR